MKALKLHAVVLVALGLMFGAPAALALTPANTSLINQAKLVYSGNPTGITAEVTVTVSLVKADVRINPAFSVPPDQSKPENASALISYKVYAQNNGEDTYTISGAVTGSNNVTAPGGGYVITPSVGSIELGATALAAISPGGSPTVTVPSDGTSDGEVNGLAPTDTVVINNIEYTVLSVVDNASGTSTITFTANIPGGLPVGEGIFESETFTMSVADVGAKTVSATPAADITVTTSLNNGATTFTDDVDIDIVEIIMTKLVRCISLCDESGGTGAVSYDSGSGANNYFDGGVTAEPGGVLEYLIVMDNPTGTAITGAVLSDTLPQYTSYVSGTTLLNTLAVSDDTVTADPNDFPLASDADDGGLLVGTSGSLTGGEDTGSLNGVARVVYRIQVD